MDTDTQVKIMTPTSIMAESALRKVIDDIGLELHGETPDYGRLRDVSEVAANLAAALDSILESEK